MPCKRIYMREWCKNHPGRNAKYEERAAKLPGYQAKKRSAWIKHTYGITAEDRDRMRDEQGGQCLICKKVPTGEWWYGLVIDHCHSTGRVRGLLCNRCNSNLGWYEREHENIQRYLKERK
jgi:hypothetical protein